MAHEGYEGLNSWW